MHRHTDPRDTVAEMAARAQEISQEAGSRIGKAMKDIISAAAGLAGFAVESARDLAQYMVRRGQMTQEEADKLIQEAEAAFAKRAKPTKPAASPVATPRKAAPPTPTAKPTVKPAAKSAAAKKGAKPKATKTAVRASTPKKKSAATSARTKSPAKPAKKKK
ncbi:MAG TPA: hypothetical protein VFJ96_11450 [Gemmatimonadaceae bacterium]|nr:hypothetical protein [Gemmatimonadaceae bacterium]